MSAAEIPDVVLTCDVPGWQREVDVVVAGQAVTGTHAAGANWG